MSDLPDGWVETSLAEVINTANTGLDAIKRAPIVLEDTGVKCFRIQDASQTKSYNKWGFTKVEQKNYDKFKLLEGDILIARTGNSIGVNFLVQKDTKSVFNNGLIRLRTNNKIRYDFLYKIISSKLFQRYIQSIAYGTSTQPNMQINVLLSFNLLLPPLPEQKAIANILTAFDKKIALLQAQNQTLETLAQTIFKQWFVDFNYPDATGEMIDSELGKIPKEWKVGRLVDEFKITMGQSPKGSTYNIINDGMVFYQGRAEFQNRFPKRRLFTTNPKRIAEPFDVLMSVRAPVGNINVAIEECCIGRGLSAIQSQYKSYALYKMKSLKKVFDLFESSGTVFGSINKTSLENIEVIIPNKNLVKQYDIATKTLDDKILNNHKQIITLTKNRDTLLPKLMNGKRRLENV